MNEYPQARPDTTNHGHFIPVAAAGSDMPPGAQYFNLPSFAGFSWPFVDHSQEELKHHTVGFVKPSPRPSPYNVKVEKTDKPMPSASGNPIDRKPAVQKDKLPVTATQVGLQVHDPHPYKKARKQYRKARTLFSPLQLEKLENEFQKTKYLSTWDREKLARYLQITDTQVKTWFQNRRKKWKRTNGHIGAQLEGCRVGKLYGALSTHGSAGTALPDPHRHIKHNLSSFNVVTPHFTTGGSTGGIGGSLQTQTSEHGGHVMGTQPDHMLFLSS